MVKRILKRKKAERGIFFLSIQSLAKVTLHLFEWPSTKKLQRYNRFEKCKIRRNLLEFYLGVSFDYPATITVGATLNYQNIQKSKIAKKCKQDFIGELPFLRLFTSFLSNLLYE